MQKFENGEEVLCVNQFDALGKREASYVGVSPLRADKSIIMMKTDGVLL